MGSKNVLLQDEDYKTFVEINIFSTYFLDDFVRSRFCRRKRIPLTLNLELETFFIFPFQQFLEYMGYYKKGDKEISVTQHQIKNLGKTEAISNLMQTI